MNKARFLRVRIRNVRHLSVIKDITGSYYKCESTSLPTIIDESISNMISSNCNSHSLLKDLTADKQCNFAVILILFERLRYSFSYAHTEIIEDLTFLDLQLKQGNFTYHLNKVLLFKLPT